MPRNRQLADIPLDLQFPLLGVDDERAYGRQRSGTTADALNVRVFEPGTNRARGGQRPGLSRFFDAQVVGEYPIQCIDHLVTNEVVASASSIGHFGYALTSGNGFGVGDNTGVSVFTNTGTASFAKSCECWDDDGYVYTGEINTTTGATRIHKYNAAGTVQTNFPITSLTGLTTGSLRVLAGMVLIGDYLYVAMRYSSGAAGRIHKIHKTTGAVTTSWASTSSFSGLNFSTASKNCLGKCGTVLGVECVATGTSQCFKQFDTTKGTAKLLVSRPYTGTAAHNASRVVSDGIGFFYVIASVSTSMIKKIGLGGVIEWSSTAADTPTGLAYNFSTGQLVATVASTPSVRSLSLTAGSLVSSADPSSVTNYSYIDSDNHGFYMLYRDGVASDDVNQINTSFSVTSGFPVTLANTTHSGSAVNKGKVLANTAGQNRQTRIAVVNNGECRVWQVNPADTAPVPSAVTNGDSFNVPAPVIFSAINMLDLFFVDGTIYRYLDSGTNQITAWTPTAGSLPVDSQSGRARLICTWRGRTVLAGLPWNPQNLYMSKQNDPFDWDYAPTTQTVQQAFSGNDSMSGQIPDIINCLISYNDDTMVVGCDHTIWQITGDPMAGGQWDNISQTIGMAWGRPFALDPSGQIYFMSNTGAIYKMTPGSLPVRCSQQIDRRLESIDHSKNLVRLAWDLNARGLYVFVTPYDATEDTTHYFWEERTDAWMPFQFANPDHNPLAVHVYDGDLPDDRVVLLGGRDGRVRYFDNAATKDDGTTINSEVWLGPILTKDLAFLVLKELQATLGETSGDITYSIHVGDSAEKAFGSEAVQSGTWSAGRNPDAMAIWGGQAIYVKLSATKPFSLEMLRCTYSPMGKERRRM